MIQANMKVPIIFTSYVHGISNRDYWDYALLEDLLAGTFGSIGYDIETRDRTDTLGQVDTGAVVVLPARHHVASIERINQDLSKLDWALVLLMGDEGLSFPWEKLKHPNMKIWVQSPRPGRHDGLRYLPNGYPPQLRDHISNFEKNTDYFFAGQISHRKRQEMFAAIGMVNNLNGVVMPTKGFAQGESHTVYYDSLARTRVALCPAGSETPDTFRLYEALELGCVPIVDRLPSREGYPDGFWEYMLGETPPFVFVDSWEGIEKLIPRVLMDWKAKANECMAWWKVQKRRLAKNLEADLYLLNGGRT